MIFFSDVNAGGAKVRPATDSEIAQVDAEIDRVRLVIARKERDLSSLKWNPLNYALETQRDAMKRLENAVAQDKRILSQLENLRVQAFENAGYVTNALQLAKVVGSSSDMAIWEQGVQYSRASATAGTVARDTAKDIGKGLSFGLPLVAAVGGAGFLLYMFARGRAAGSR